MFRTSRSEELEGFKSVVCVVCVCLAFQAPGVLHTWKEG